MDRFVLRGDATLDDHGMGKVKKVLRTGLRSHLLPHVDEIQDGEQT
jgi:hypothetical protein